MGKVKLGFDTADAIDSLDTISDASASVVIRKHRRRPINTLDQVALNDIQVLGTRDVLVLSHGRSTMVQELTFLGTARH